MPKVIFKLVLIDLNHVSQYLYSKYFSKDCKHFFYCTLEDQRAILLIDLLGKLQNIEVLLNDFDR